MMNHDDKGGKEYFKKVIAGILQEFGMMNLGLLAHLVPLPEEILLVLLKELETDGVIYQKEIKGGTRWGEWV